MFSIISLFGFFCQSASLNCTTDSYCEVSNGVAWSCVNGICVDCLAGPTEISNCKWKFGGNTVCSYKEENGQQTGPTYDYENYRPLCPHSINTFGKMFNMKVLAEKAWGLRSVWAFEKDSRNSKGIGGTLYDFPLGLAITVKSTSSQSTSTHTIRESRQWRQVVSNKLDISINGALNARSTSVSSSIGRSSAQERRLNQNLKQGKKMIEHESNEVLLKLEMKDITKMALDGVFKTSVDTLEDYLQKNANQEVQKAFDFFENVGTHYFSGGTIGGWIANRELNRTCARKSEAAESTSTEDDAEVTVASDTGVVSGEGSVAVSRDESENSDWQEVFNVESSDRKFKRIGGTSAAWKEGGSQWQDSVKVMPKFVNPTMSPVWDLLDKFGYSKSADFLKKHFVDYLDDGVKLDQNQVCPAVTETPSNNTSTPSDSAFSPFATTKILWLAVSSSLVPARTFPVLVLACMALSSFSHGYSIGGLKLDVALMGKGFDVKTLAEKAQIFQDRKFGHEYENSESTSQETFATKDQWLMGVASSLGVDPAIQRYVGQHAEAMALLDSQKPLTLYQESVTHVDYRITLTSGTLLPEVVGSNDCKRLLNKFGTHVVYQGDFGVQASRQRFANANPMWTDFSNARALDVRYSSLLPTVSIDSGNHVLVRGGDKNIFKANYSLWHANTQGNLQVVAFAVEPIEKWLRLAGLHSCSSAFDEHFQETTSTKQHSSAIHTTASPQMAGDSTGDSTVVIVGAICGALAFLCLLWLGYCRYRGKNPCGCFASSDYRQTDERSHGHGGTTIGRQEAGRQEAGKGAGKGKENGKCWNCGEDVREASGKCWKCSAELENGNESSLQAHNVEAATAAAATKKEQGWW